MLTGLETQSRSRRRQIMPWSIESPRKALKIVSSRPVWIAAKLHDPYLLQSLLLRASASRKCKWTHVCWRRRMWWNCKGPARRRRGKAAVSQENNHLLSWVKRLVHQNQNPEDHREDSTNENSPWNSNVRLKVDKEGVCNPENHSNPNRPPNGVVETQKLIFWFRVTIREDSIFQSCVCWQTD